MRKKARVLRPYHHLLRHFFLKTYNFAYFLFTVLEMRKHPSYQQSLGVEFEESVGVHKFAWVFWNAPPPRPGMGISRQQLLSPSLMLLTNQFCAITESITVWISTRYNGETVIFFYPKCPILVLTAWRPLLLITPDPGLSETCTLAYLSSWQPSEIPSQSHFMTIGSHVNFNYANLKSFNIKISTRSHFIYKISNIANVSQFLKVWRII